MNIEPNRKIESSFLLEPKVSWGSGIMVMTVEAGKLKDPAVPRRFAAFLIAQICGPGSILLLTRYHIWELINCRLL